MEDRGLEFVRSMHRISGESSEPYKRNGVNGGSAGVGESMGKKIIGFEIFKEIDVNRSEGKI